MERELVWEAGQTESEINFMHVRLLLDACKIALKPKHYFNKYFSMFLSPPLNFLVAAAASD